MDITITIPDDTIADYVERANISYWASNAEWDAEKFVLTFVEDDTGEPHAVNREDFRAGLQKMVEQKYVKTLGEIIDDEGDMYTGDVMIQFACFGEERFA